MRKQVCVHVSVWRSSLRRDRGCGCLSLACSSSAVIATVMGTTGRNRRSGRLQSRPPKTLLQTNTHTGLPLDSSQTLVKRPIIIPHMAHTHKVHLSSKTSTDEDNLPSNEGKINSDTRRIFTKHLLCKFSKPNDTSAEPACMSLMLQKCNVGDVLSVKERTAWLGSSNKGQIHGILVTDVHVAEMFQGVAGVFTLTLSFYRRHNQCSHLSSQTEDTLWTFPSSHDSLLLQRRR